MDAEVREERINKIMNELLNSLIQRDPRSLTWMSEQYREENEVGLCMIAFSRLEAEGLIIQRPDGKWEVSEEKLPNIN